MRSGLDKIKILLGLSIALWGSAASAQKTSLFDPLDGQLDMSQYLSENAYGFLPVPIIITDPAVGGGLGAVGLFFHEKDDSREQRLKAMRSAEQNASRYLLPPSVSALAVAVTGNNSWFAGGGHMGFFKEGDIRYTVGGGYGDVNLDFYGVGDVELNRPLEIKTNAGAIIQRIKFRVPESSWFLGFTQNYIRAEISPNSLGALDEILPPEWSDSLKQILTTNITTSGLGVVAEYDSRDTIFTPTKGYQYQLESMWFTEAVGSDTEYQLNKLQGLHYWPLTEQWRMGLKLAAEQADSDGLLPPYATPSIKLRGIPAMRYQGLVVGMAEAEVVWAANRRWRGVAFAGLGRASNRVSEFSVSENRNTYGLGFRYQIARRYGFDMGMDVAKGPEGYVWYITAGSAWAGL